MNGICNFDNIPPCCKTATDCGDEGDWDCVSGSCYEIDEDGLHRPSKECNRQEPAQIGRNPGGGGGSDDDSDAKKSKKGMGRRH